MAKRSNNRKIYTFSLGKDAQLEGSWTLFRVKSCTGQFYVTFDNDDKKILVRAGSKFVFPERNPCRKVLLEGADTDYDVDVEVLLGEFDYDDPAFNRDERTYAIGYQTELADGAFLDLSLPIRTHRRQIILTNMNSGVNDVLDIYGVDDDRVSIDDGGSPGSAVFPRQAWTIPTSSNLMIKNDSGTPLTVRILESFYV